MQSLRRLTADLRSWPAVRWFAALAVAVLSAALLVLASALPFAGADAGALWSLAAVASGSALTGLIVASYFRTPIGADATLCDLRWPALGLVALHFSTDLRSAEPLLFGAVRPVVAIAAIALLLWALRDRLESERRATDADAEASGEVCTTCRPLFTRTAAADAHDHTTDPTPTRSGSVSGTA
ncbi:hypothetical protein GCM10027057_04890 [Marisediminicola antarctica]|uniref:Uncharacterized protein n=1 Tax=Marisediminicola antarctica TaxID=674079 RepID=A0A7L5AE50_9MICO|nr:hypothetical protein BHD05_01660 [Marisediminicola antarctica]